MKAVVNYYRMTSNYEQLFIFSEAINSCWLATAPEEGPLSSSRNVYSFRNAGMETPFKWQVSVNAIYCEDETLRRILTVPFYFSVSYARSRPNKSSVTEKCWHIMGKMFH